MNVNTMTDRWWMLTGWMLILAALATSVAAHAQDTTSVLVQTVLEEQLGEETITYHYGRLLGEDRFGIALFGRDIDEEVDPYFTYYTDDDGALVGRSVPEQGFEIPYSGTVLDFDRDGIDDIVSQHNGRLLLRRGAPRDDQPSFEPAEVLADVRRGVHIGTPHTFFDVNRDGYEDVLYTGSGGKTNGVWLAFNNRGRGLLPQSFPITADYAGLVYAGDLTGDGRPELVVREHASEWASDHAVLFADASGRFGAPVPIEFRPEDDVPVGVVAFDVVGGPEREIVAYHRRTESADDDPYSLVLRSAVVKAYGADPALGLVERAAWEVPGLDSVVASAAWHRLYPGDLTGDARRDVVFTREGSGETVRHFYAFGDSSLQLLRRDTTRLVDTMPFIALEDGSYIRINRETHVARPAGSSMNVVVEERRAPTTVPPPRAPSALSATVSEGAVRLQWHAATSEAGEPSYHFDVVRADGSFTYRSEYLRVFPLAWMAYAWDHGMNATRGTEAYLQMLRPGTYRARVRAVDGAGQYSDYSETVSFTIDEAVAPSTPSVLSTKAIDGNIRLRFALDGPVDSVRVYRGAESTWDGARLLGTAELGRTNYHDRSVERGQTYTYWLEAYRDGRTSGRSAPAEASGPGFMLAEYKFGHPGYRIRRVVPYDIDGDGWYDLVALMRSSTATASRLVFVPGTAEGFAFERVRVLAERSDLKELFVGDWDGDLRPDLFTVDDAEGAVHIYRTVDGVVRGTEQIELPAYGDQRTPEFLGVADFDLDGRADLLVGSERYNLLQAGWNDEGSVTYDSLSGEYAGATLIYDANQDGYPDVLHDDRQTRRPVLQLSDGDRGFVPSDTGLPDWEAGEYDGFHRLWLDDDAYPDLLVFRTYTIEMGHDEYFFFPSARVFTYDADSETYHETALALTDGSHAAIPQVRPVHLDGDGYIDFVQVTEAYYRLWMNEGNQVLRERRLARGTSGVLTGFFHADHDHDGDWDPFFALSGEPALYQIRNDESIQNAAPDVPRDVRVEGDSGAVAVTWSASADDGSRPGHVAYGVVLMSEADTFRVGDIDISTGRPAAPGQMGIHVPEITFRSVPPGSYTLRIAATNPWGATSDYSAPYEVDVTSTTVETGNTVPEGVRLEPPYPHPSAGSVHVSFALPQTASLRVVIYDLMGRTVGTLVTGRYPAGRHAVHVETRLAPGLYFLRLVTRDEVDTQPLTIVR